jgi:xylulokinase
VAKAVGSVPLASFTVTKLRWLARHEPENANA